MTSKGVFLISLVLGCGSALAQPAAPPAPAPSSAPALPTSSVPKPSALPQPQAPVSVTATRNEPTPLEFSADKLSKLSVPQGFALSVMATGLGNTRMMHVMPDGSIYLTRRQQGDIWLLKDTNKDGKFEGSERQQVAQNLKLVHGLDVKGGKLYAVGEKTIWVMDMARDGSLSTPRVFADHFPDAGQHPARGLKWGPDGYLYASFGSTNNDQMTQNPEEATIIRVAPDGKSREVFARGLRHTIGFGWQPQTGVMYGFDQGSDWHGDNVPPEELNTLVRGNNYGWPYCYGDKQVDPYTTSSNLPGNVTKAEYCATTQGSTLTYTAHAAAIGMQFYTGKQFPADYKGDAFVAFRGSWNRDQPSGYQLARVHFDPSGKPQSVTPFVTGFVYQDGNEWKEFGRLAGVAQYTDGSLLFTDDESGVLYRLRYVGNK